MRERDIRLALIAYLAQLHAGDSDTLVVEEVGVREGRSRVDLAVVNGRLHGFEIKSHQDTLARLPTQIKDYAGVFDEVTLVVAPKHVPALLEKLPPWCGVLVANEVDGRIELSRVRADQTNPEQQAFELVQMLWRDEAYEILCKRGLASGWKNKRRHEIWRELANKIPMDELAREVRTALKSRAQGWKSDSRRRLCGG